MDTLIRGAVIYVFLLLVFRIAGKRSLSSMTTFDFVLVLIISETVQQALIDSDNSMTNAALLVLTLVGVDIAMSFVKERFPKLEKMLDSSPVVIIHSGDQQEYKMKKERVDEADILFAARQQEGIGRLDEIDYAVVEQSGDITVIPKKK
jgi:uncharacterized membrane protein YcaP (DUF421 family)